MPKWPSFETIFLKTKGKGTPTSHIAFRNTLNSTEPEHEPREVAGSKTNAKNPAIFLYICSDRSKNKMEEEIPLTIHWEKRKHLRMSEIKEEWNLHNKNFRAPLKELKTQISEEQSSFTAQGESHRKPTFSRIAKRFNPAPTGTASGFSIQTDR